MAIPYYIAKPNGFMGLNEDDPDERPAGPFDGVTAEQAAGPSPFEAPPSVRESKAAATPAPSQHSPFDEVDPRIKELDDQIKGRPGSIGGILAAFSPHGDRTLSNLMAQRHLVGSEVHGDRQIMAQNARTMQKPMRVGDTLFAPDGNGGWNKAGQGTRLDEAIARGQSQILIAQQHGLDAQAVQKLRNAGVELTGDWHKDVAIINQTGANSRNSANITSRESEGAANRGSREGIAGLSNQTKQAGMTAREFADLAKLAFANGDTDGARYYSERAQEEIERNRKGAPRTMVPGAGFGDVMSGSGSNAPQPSAAPSTAPAVSQSAHEDLGPAPAGATGSGTVKLDDGSTARVNIINGRYIRA